MVYARTSQEYSPQASKQDALKQLDIFAAR